jgi:hypothetical protein
MRIQVRRGTAAEWTSKNPLLAIGEIGFETDTNKVKIGTGTDLWTVLDYLTAEGGGGSGITDGDKGDITVSGSGANWTIDNNAVTYSKIQDVAAGKILGRTPSSSGDLQEITLGTGLQLTGTTLIATSSGGSGSVDVSTIELELQLASRSRYIEFTYNVDGDITNKDIWLDDSKSTKQYSLIYSYSGGNISSISITRESDSFTYSKNFTYTDGVLESIEIT